MEVEPAVRWLSPWRETREACLVCGHRRGNRVVVEARHWVRTRGWVAFALCAACGSAFSVDDAQVHVDYPAHAESLRDPRFQLLLDHYLELTNGLDWKVAIAERLPHERIDSLLEVGCNLGVMLDYCRVRWGADAIGLEPSAYGRGGAERLGLPIVAGTLEDAPALGERRFALVLATEVIEHTRDPAAFLAALRARVAPGGWALLTTPCADALSPTAPLGGLLATLSAGAHSFVLSQRALAELLRAAGFAASRIAPSGMQQVAFAGDGPVALRRPPRVHERLPAYWRARLEQPFTDERVELAYLINACDSASRGRRPGPIAHLQPRVDDLLARRFAISLAEPLELARRAAAATDIFSFGGALPFGLPLYLRALAERQRLADRARAVELRALCALLCVHGLRVDYQNLYPYEWVYWEAVHSARSLVIAPRLTPTARRLLAELAHAERLVPSLAAARAARSRVVALTDEARAAKRWIV